MSRAAPAPDAPVADAHAPPTPPRIARTKKGRRKFDKKNAHRFTLMHRSQLDPLYDEDGASKMVLHPQNERTAEGAVYARLRAAQDREHEGVTVGEGGGESKRGDLSLASTLDQLGAVDELGLPNDGYNYKRHMRTMGGGVFVSTDGRTRASQDVLTTQVTAPLATREDEMTTDRQFEAITLTTDDMPEDVAMALDSDYDDFDYEDSATDGRIIHGAEGAFEMLQADFVAEASKERDDDGGGGFDFKAHIARLMRHADGNYSDREDEADWYDEDEDGEEFDLEALGLTTDMMGADGRSAAEEMTMQPMDPEEEERMMRMETTMEASVEAASRPRRDLDDAFDVLMAREYSNQQVGDLDEELCAEDGLAEQLDGVRLDADKISSMLDQFLEEDGQRKIPLTGQQLHAQFQHVKEFAENRAAAAAAAAEEHGDASEAGASKAEPTVLNASRLGKGKPGETSWTRGERFLPRRLRAENQWDCESVVSTYSNLDNHPRLLGQTRRDGRLSKPLIKLSKKTGMPIGALDRYDIDSSDDEEEDDEAGAEEEDAEEDVMRPNLGLARPKKETKAEKRARKKALKAERKARRLEKKQMKTAFKNETKRQLKGMRASDGISVTPLN